MKTTITIEYGNQYDREGYNITDGTLFGFGSKSDNTNGFTGPSCPLFGDDIDTAIRATLVDGLTREITYGEDEEIKPMPESHACPKCGTYCYGDCEAY